VSSAQSNPNQINPPLLQSASVIGDEAVLDSGGKNIAELLKCWYVSLQAGESGRDAREQNSLELMQW
jgi:hypothetical protein